MSGEPREFWLEVAWRNLGLPDGPGQPFFVAVALLMGFAFIVIPISACLSLFERKFAAGLQARVGPNRSGPAGLFQPLADLLKLLRKESRAVWTWRETAWLTLHTMALYSTFAVLPLGSAALLVDTDMSALLPFWSALVLALGTLLLGLDQGTIQGWLGGIRVAAQAIAGAFPAFVGLLCVGIRVGSFRWTEIAASQGAFPQNWGIFADPFQWIAFGAFLVGGLILMSVAPLDAALSISDIHGGVLSKLSGRKLSLFRLGRFYGFFLWTTITVVLFFGGWTLPGFLVSALGDESGRTLIHLLELGVLLVKTLFLMTVILWIAKVTPRPRVDQITDLSWKVLSPFALFALIGLAFWYRGIGGGA